MALVSPTPFYCYSRSILTPSKGTRAMCMLSLVTFLSTLGVAPNGMERSAFCNLVNLNHGCCPACGYGWVDGECKKLDEVVESSSSTYCHSLESPAQRGCCSYCGHKWSATASKCVLAADIPLVTFDGQKGTTHDWMTVNDPVMGGASKSTFAVKSGVGTWAGEVKLVPGLGSAGFCTARTVGDEHGRFADCSGTAALELTVSGGSGLSPADFSIEVGVKGVTTAQTAYHGALLGKYCCGDYCRVPWSSFELQFRGQPAKGQTRTIDRTRDRELVRFGADGNVHGRSARLRLPRCASLAAAPCSLIRCRPAAQRAP